MTKLPLRHLSIRVPWHDAGWNGTVCDDPANNASCLRLGNIHEKRDDGVEVQLRGRRVDEVEKLPPCVAERATFMSPHSVTRMIQHPYFEISDLHRHYRPTPYEIPAYSAGAVPFRWLLQSAAEEIAENFDISYQAEAEENLRGLMKFSSSWVQDVHNQRTLLDSFFSAIEPNVSLAFFYAKEVPHTEKMGRVLIGVGWITDCDDAVEYDYEEGDRPTRSMIWERIVRHSIRPGTVTGGFLLPYHEALQRAGEDDSFDPETVVVFSPDEAFDQFSYASEHVSHDQAIASLLAMIEGLRRAEDALGNSYSAEIRWAQERLGELWKLRGPYPGLGSALHAFGVDHAHLLAFQVLGKLGDGQDPWPAVQAAFDDPLSIGPEWVGRIGPTLAKKLAKLPPERRALLQLLSRFDLTQRQAERFYVSAKRAQAGIDVVDNDLLENPFLIYELDRVSADPVAISVIDRGLHPDPSISAAFPVPPPSAMEESQDPRRVRALMVAILESAVDSGHTLLPEDEVVLGVGGLAIEPPCAIDPDLIAVVSGLLQPVIRPAQLADGRPAHQLDRFAASKQRIGSEIRKRAGAPKRHEVSADWDAVLAERLPNLDPTDEAEVRARQEKSAALAELAAARVSVLVGPAGTGKTTLLSALCSQPVVRDAGVTLLAPTGKARVQLERGMASAGNLRAKTIAQFLVPSGRYDPDTGRYQRSSEPPIVRGGTVIIDESSMLTEEQLDAVLDGIAGVDRLILVGDHRQLPPIGAGRPFVDIVRELEPGVSSSFPRVGPSYAELTVLRRQRAEADAVEFRHDLALAQWFGGDSPSPLADEAWAHALVDGKSETLRFEQWDNPTEVFPLLQRLLVEEVEAIETEDDQLGFGESLGGQRSGDYIYFNNAYGKNKGAGEICEQWQILSPVHATGAGVSELNRSIHRHYRADLIEMARNANRWGRRVPKPMGPEGVVYGDKVMNNRNHAHYDHYPKEWKDGDRPTPAAFVANGEIGMVVGQFKRKGQKFKVTKLQVEFSTQPGLQYGYGGRFMPTDGDPYLELAYAITVHKSQGSEFGTTFLVIPNPCRLLSRELLYTALTRQTDRVVVLHQGPLGELLTFSSVDNSETARRYTNIFDDPAPVQVRDGRFLESGLIHRTANGTLVRSKSEVTIADALFDHGVAFEYEQEFRGADGRFRLPDFTIEDAATGETYIWEHLGLLGDPEYARSWDRKKAWYEANGVTELGGDRGTLIVTTDDERGGIDSAAVRAMIGDRF